jgi:hypothetical protein
MTCVIYSQACCSRTARARPNVKKQMGYSSIQVTVDIYGHLVPGGNRQAVDRLDDAPVITKKAATA